MIGPALRRRLLQWLQTEPKPASLVDDPRFQFERIEPRRLLSTMVGWDGSALSVQDALGNQDNDLIVSVASDGAGLIVHDASQTVDTSIVGATQIDSHTVRIDFVLIDAQGVDRLKIGTLGGTDRVRLELAGTSESLLSQFESFSIDLGGESGDVAAIVGDGEIEAKVGLGSGLSPTNITLSTPADPTLSSTLTVSATSAFQGVDLVGFSAVIVRSGAADDQLQIAVGVDAATGSSLAWQVSGQGDAVDFTSLQLVDVKRVEVDTSDLDGKDSILVLGLDSQQGIEAVKIRTGLGDDSLVWSGNGSLQGSLAIESGNVSITAAIETEGGDVAIQAREVFQLRASIVTLGGQFDLVAGEGIELDTNSSVDTSGSTTGKIDGGQIKLAVDQGDLEIDGALVSRGASVDLGTAGRGGDVKVVAYEGELAIAKVDVSGGDHSNSAGHGGDAGSIVLIARNPSGLSDGEIRLSEMLRSEGGLGQNGSNGSSGKVRIEAAGAVVGQTNAVVFSESLGIVAGQSVGTSSEYLATQVNLLEVVAKGNVYVMDLAGGLHLADLDGDGVAISAAGGAIGAKSPLTVSDDVLVSDDFALTAGNSNSAGDDLTIDSGAVVRLSSTSGPKTLTLAAGDDLVVVDGQIEAVGGLHRVQLLADREGDAGVGDGDGGTITQQVVGQVVLQSHEVVMEASLGLGSLERAWNVDVAKLDVTTSGQVHLLDVASGMQLLDLTGDGVAVSAAGGAIEAKSPLMVSDDVLVSGSFSLTAGSSRSAGDDLTIDSGAVVRLSSASGPKTLTLSAGDDLVVVDGRIEAVGELHRVNLLADREGDAGVGDGDGGTITQQVAGQVVLQSHEAVLEASRGIGAANQALTLDVTKLDAESSGQVTLLDVAGGLQLVDLTADGVAVTAAGGAIEARSPLTISDDVFVSGSFSLTAGNSNVAGDDLTIDSGAVIRLSSTSGPKTLTLSAGDDLVVVDGRIEAVGELHRVNLLADREGDAGVGDGDGGTITQQVVGQVVLQSHEAVLEASRGIGTANQALTIDVTKLDTESSGQVTLLDVAGGLQLVDLTGDGVAVAAAGGAIEARSPLTISDDVIVSGNFSLTAGNSRSAGDDLTIDSGAVIRLSSTSGPRTLTLAAGDDLVMVDGRIEAIGALHRVNLLADREGDAGIGDGDGGTITQQVAGQVVLQSHEAVLEASRGIGTANQALTIDVTKLDAESGGQLHLLDVASGLQLVDLTGDGVSVSATGGGIEAKSSLMVSDDVLVSGSFSLTAGNSNAAGDDLTIDSGAVIRLSSTSGPRTLTLSAGDDLVVVDGRMEAVGALHRVNLLADREGDAGVGDGDGGTITQQVAGQVVLQSHEAVLEASRGIGTANQALTIDVTKLDTESSGQVTLLDVAGGLQLVDLTADGVAVTAAGGAIEAKSPLTISDDVLVSGNFSLTAGNSRSAGDDLTIDSGAVVRLSSTSGPKTLTLSAGDDLVVVDGRIEAVGALHRVNLLADREGDAGVGDGDGGTITQQVAGQVVLLSHEAVLEASRGIGAANQALTVDVAKLDAESSGQVTLLDMAGGLQLVDLTADGVAVSAAGGAIEARSPLTISDDVFVSGSFSLTAGNSNAAGDDLTIDSGAVVRLSSTSGPKTLTLSAGDDLVVFDGRIEAVGDLHRVNLLADREGDAGVGDGDGGTITQQVAGQVVLLSHEAVLEASRGIGAANQALTVDAAKLDAESSGQIQILDVAGGLQLVDLTGDGVAISAAGGAIEARSPLTISDDVIVSGNFSLTAGNSRSAGDDLTIDSGAVVRLSSTSGPRTLTLAAGDDLVVVDGRIEAIGALHRVNLLADREGDAGGVDGDGGTITQQVAGQVVLQSHEALIEGSRGIGSGAFRWTMEVDRLATDSSWGGGDQFLDDVSGDLGLQSLRAGAGMIDLRVQGDLVDADPSSPGLDVEADSAVLEAGGAIGLLQLDLNRLAVTAGARIELHDVDDLVIDQVGRLDGALLNAGGTNVDLIVRAEGTLSVRAPVVQTGTGAIELVGTSLMMDGNRGDITNADGPIRLNARTGVLGTVDGVLVEARDSIWLQADDMVLSSGSRIHVLQSDGELWIGATTSDRKIGLGDSAGGGLGLSSAETLAFDADRIRVGVTANSFFASATAGEIELRDWATASTFAADFLALRTTSQIRGGGNLDLSAGSTDLVMRSGDGIDLTEGAGSRNLGVVAARNTSGSRGIAIDDTVDGLTIGIVDGVDGIESLGGDLRVAAKGVTADLLVTATVVRHGSGVLELVADDTIVITASTEVRGIGSGDVRLGSDRDGLAGDGVAGFGASPDGILFQELASQVGRVDGGAGAIELDGGRGPIHLGHVVNTRTGSDSIVIRTEGEIEDGRSIAGADAQSQGEIRFEAGESIGDGDAIEVSAPRVNAVVIGDGDLTLRNLSTADSSWITEIQGQGELRITSLPGRIDLEARTANGPIEIEAGSAGILARAIEAGGDQDIRIQTISGGDVVVERITTGGRVTILSDGALDARATNGAVEIEAEELVAVAGRGVGSTHQLDVIVDRLEAHGGTQGIDLQAHGPTRLVNLDPINGVTGTAVSSSGGSISLLVAGDLTVRNRVLHAGVGSIELRIDGAGTLDVRAPIAAAAGDLSLIAGTTNDSDLILRDSLPNGVAELRVGGAGRVVGSAGGDIRFDAPAGGHVLVATTTGTATSVAPLATLIAVDQGGSNVNALGNALVDVQLDGVANEINRNYGIELNWNDLIFPIDTFPLPGNPVANPATRFDGGTYRFFHNFPLGNPDQLNPANDIPVDMTVRFDPRPDGLGGTIFGIDFFVDGQSVAVTTQRVELSVPGDGLFGAIVFPPAEIERIAELPVSQVVIREVSTPVVIQQTDGLESVSVLEEELKESGTRLFYRVLDAEGQATGEEIELPLEFLDRGRLFEYFKQLPDGRYTLLLEEAGDPLPRTLLELNVDQHRLVPLEQDGEGNPELEPEMEQEKPESSEEETMRGGEGSDLLPITLPNATTKMTASTETPTDSLVTKLGESVSAPYAARELAIDLTAIVSDREEGASGEPSRTGGVDSRWLGLLPVSSILTHRRFTRMTGGLGWTVIERSEAGSLREGLLSTQVAGRKDAER